MTAAETRLIEAAQHIVADLAPQYWQRRWHDEPLSPIAEVAVRAEHLDLVKDAAAIARIVVYPAPPSVDPRDRSIARLTPVECSPPDRCWIGAEHTSLSWEPCFIRERPQDLMSSVQFSMLKHWALVLDPRLARPRRIDRGGIDLTVAFDRVPGTDIDRLDPISAPLALALLAEARAGLDALHQEGMTHGALSPRRVRVGPVGKPTLCYALDPQPTTAAADHASLARILLATAFDDPLLFEILASEEDGVCTVACDRIVELEPRLDDLAVAALRPDRRPDLVRPALTACGVREHAVGLLAVVMEEIVGA